MKNLSLCQKACTGQSVYGYVLYGEILPLTWRLVCFDIHLQKGRMENLEIWNPESEIGDRNRKRNRTNKGMLQLGKYDWHQYSSSLLCIPRKMDGDSRSPFKKRHKFKEHSSYHSLQLDWVWDDVLITQNIFTFVGHDNTGELVEMWIRVTNFWLHFLCKTKTLSL